MDLAIAAFVSSWWQRNFRSLECSAVTHTEKERQTERKEEDFSDSDTEVRGTWFRRDPFCEEKWRVGRIHWRYPCLGTSASEFKTYCAHCLLEYRNRKHQPPTSQRHTKTAKGKAPVRVGTSIMFSRRHGEDADGIQGDQWTTRDRLWSSTGGGVQGKHSTPHRYAVWV